MFVFCLSHSDKDRLPGLPNPFLHKGCISSRALADCGLNLLIQATAGMAFTTARSQIRTETVVQERQGDRGQVGLPPVGLCLAA